MEATSWWKERAVDGRGGEREREGGNEGQGEGAVGLDGRCKGTIARVLEGRG